MAHRPRVRGAEFPALAGPGGHALRPVLRGAAGAVAAAHPLAAAAGQEMLTGGGSAVDAVIAAQAVLCVVAPQACGLGGDMTALVRTPAGVTTAVLGSGAGVPGIVDAWDRMQARWSRLTLPRLLGPATRLARGGMRMSPRMAKDMASVTARDDAVVEQLELAQLLDRIAKERAVAFYTGLVAEALVRSSRSQGGTLSAADLAAHRTRLAACVRIDWRGGRVWAPPVPQAGVLASALAGLRNIPVDRLDPAAARLTQGDGVTGNSAAVAASDRFGLTVAAVSGYHWDSRLGAYVQEAGILNGAGVAPARVANLMPILAETARGALAFAASGRGGSVPALLQVLAAAALEGADLATAVCRPRWAHDAHGLRVEAGHPGLDALRGAGPVILTPAEDPSFGDAGSDVGIFAAVVCAGHIDDEPLCVADGRRDNWAGVA